MFRGNVIANKTESIGHLSTRPNAPGRGSGDMASNVQWQSSPNLASNHGRRTRTIPPPPRQIDLLPAEAFRLRSLCRYAAVIRRHILRWVPWKSSALEHVALTFFSVLCLVLTSPLFFFVEFLCFFLSQHRYFKMAKEYTVEEGKSIAALLGPKCIAATAN